MRILFIGNSHTYFNDMPHLCAELLRAAGKDVEVTMLTRAWAYSQRTDAL